MRHMEPSRLSRLTQSAPDMDLEIGWLVELDLPDGEPLLTGRRLADALRDMRLLGLQPTLMAGARSVDERESGMTAGAAAVSRQAGRGP